MTTLRSTPLAAVHESLGASFTDFAGWNMPVRYSSDLAEHHAVRKNAGIFDLSHMGEIRISGPDAGAALDYALAGKLSAVAEGRAKYSLLLTDDGGVVDDLVTYHLPDGDYLVVANAANAETDLAEFTKRCAQFDVTVTDAAGRTILDETRTTYDNGFLGFWLPRDITATLTIDAAAQHRDFRLCAHRRRPGRCRRPAGSRRSRRRSGGAARAATPRSAPSSSRR